ncbi:MAG TPA: DNA cytosine methyltransferase, partial [Armatimonadota bacterium]|nr:DNA cytosine methyltransferase [Armatimonadota bacterium]
SKTVIAGGDSGGGRSHLHPFAARTMTVRECARLQTFPDEYFFTGPMGRQFTQVGNAVPPLLAEHVARSLLASAFSVPVPDRSLLEPSWLDRLSAGEATRELLRVTAEREPELLYDDAET